VTLLALASTPVLTCAQASENPWNLPDFSATQISEGSPMSPQMPPWKIYRSGRNFRTEQATGQATIYRPDDNKVFDISDNGAVCMEMPINKAPIMRSALQPPSGTKIEKKLIGTDTVDGHACKIENMSFTSPDGKTSQAKVWEANDLNGFPIKIEALGSPTLIFRDIVLATPDPELFRPPSKCPRVEDIKAKPLPTVKVQRK
jgi:hypothetical protein